MSRKKGKSRLFWAIREAVRVVYPEIQVEGLENLSEEPCIVVGNHCQLHGPIACELYFPDCFYTWCAGEMMRLSEVPSYAYCDFWSQKPKWQRPFFKLASFLIAPLSVVVFNHARTVPVWKDNRILSTFRESIAKLEDGKNLVIFPEHDQKHNHIVYDFQQGFVDLAKIYFGRTGKEISFVPLYIAPNLHKMVLGNPVAFCSDVPIEEERGRICGAMMEEITKIAENLPPHTVVPYRNIPRKFYPQNFPKEETK